MYSYFNKEKTKFHTKWQRSFEMLYVRQLHFSNASEKEDKICQVKLLVSTTWMKE